MEELTYKEQQFYQCIKCGKVHSADINKVIDLNDDIYYGVYCSHCRGVTKHLWAGETEEDRYLWEDPVFDERYY